MGALIVAAAILFVGQRVGTELDLMDLHLTQVRQELTFIREYELDILNSLDDVKNEIHDLGTK